MNDSHKYNRELLNAAYACWCAGAGRRAQRERLKRYTYGDQWGDMVSDGHGNIVREGDLITASGRKPLANNLIRRLVKTIVGRYRTNRDQWRKGHGVDAEVERANVLAELDARLFEEFLISGMAVQRVAREKRFGTERVYVDNISPQRFFANAFMDPRGHDMEMAGVLHDMSLPEVLSRFGRGDRRVMQRLRGIYGDAAASVSALPGAESSFYCAGNGRCRVIEMWTLEAIETVRRIKTDITFGWRCRWMAPGGEVLACYFSPWAHRSHPFLVRFYPLTDGEVHPFVEDVVDQQKFINRLIVMLDKMMGSAAKGVLLFPQEQLTPGMTWDEVAERWSSTDAVIPISGRCQTIPHQVNTNISDNGAYRLLDLELKLFNDVSGVSDALLGKTEGGNAGSALYESRVNNATIALADIFDTFNALIAARDNLIKQS